MLVLVVWRRSAMCRPAMIRPAAISPATTMISSAIAVIVPATTMIIPASAVLVPVATIIIAVSIMAMLGLIAGASVVAASAIVMEAMAAPAVRITPASPWSNAEEDAVVEISRSVEAHWRAFVGRGFVVTVRANRRWGADFNRNLCASCWRQHQTRKQCCRAE